MSKVTDYLKDHPIALRKDMADAGIHSRDIHDALETGVLCKVGPGIYAGDEAMAHPELEFAVASASTGGVIGLHTAAGIHGLIDKDGTERVTEIFVPRSVHTRGSVSMVMPLMLMRSTDERRLSVGVETRDILGIAVRITNKARTVVDLLRNSVRQHAVTALGTYVTEDNDLGELHRIAEEFGVGTEISAMVDAAQEVRKRPGF